MSGGDETPSPRDMFGTDEPPPERRLLRAGALSAVLEEGNLRDIRFRGVEGVRAVNWLARDPAWGTMRTALSDMEVEEEPDRFAVSFSGECAGANGRLRFRMRIEGTADGRLDMLADGEALSDFHTNRTGFVVLHPAEAAGRPLRVRHMDGRTADTVFPDAISPDQPLFDIRALAHEPAPGLRCTVEMKGDAFEMEDQRNWSDASFKTYVRPLAKPRPYTIAKGATERQRVSIVFDGLPSAPAVSTGAASSRLTLGDPVGRMPALALFLDPDEPAPTDPASLKGTAGELVIRHDVTGGDVAALRHAADLARAADMGLAVEAVMDARDPAGEAALLMQALSEVRRATGMSPEAILVSPRREFRTRPSGALPEGEHGTGALVRAIRAAPIRTRVGAGTPSLFTEFNRNPPDADCDFAFFGVSANVHAADDLSIVETLRTYPAMLASARRLLPAKPIRLGPCLLGMRHNPYGAAPAPNPGFGRVPAARLDPRQGALFGAAFAVGIAAAALEAGDLERLTLAAPTGPFGLFAPDGRPRPIHAVHQVLARAVGAERLGLTGPAPGLAALAWRTEGHARIILSNVGPAPVGVRLPEGAWSAARLHADGAFRDAPPLAEEVHLSPYRTIVLASR